MTVTLNQAIKFPLFGVIPKIPKMVEYSFPVSSDLLTCAANGDLEALFQLGIYALAAKRYGYAKTIFQKAFENNHPQAHKYLEITLAKIKEND